ncbi:hypothetical protein LJD47_25560, partial [Escherichia coli]|nr:hypothetical protein [Escherichia coli]
GFVVDTRLSGHWQQSGKGEDEAGAAHESRTVPAWVIWRHGVPQIALRRIRAARLTCTGNGWTRSVQRWPVGQKLQDTMLRMRSAGFRRFLAAAVSLTSVSRAAGQPKLADAFRR